MKINPTISLFIRQALFWIIQFWIFRLVFLLWMGPEDDSISLMEHANSMFAGWKLDIAAIAYLCIVPFLLSLIQLFITNPFASRWIRVYFMIAITLAVIIQSANIAIYKYWGTLLNNRALAFTLNPAEIFASLTVVQAILMVSGLGIMVYLHFKLFRRIVRPSLVWVMQPVGKGIFWHLVVGSFLVVFGRGGLQQIPVNESAAFYSQNNTLNNIATNSIWHLGNNLRQSSVTVSNPYAYMNPETAQQQVDSLFYRPHNTTVIPVLQHTAKPNVVILLLESWTADIIEPLGGVNGVAPYFSQLCKNGLLFTSVYSSGFRTDQALVSVLSGFPAQPNKSIIRFPDKTQKLPSLARSFRERGYLTSFYYGGELGFANMKSYLMASGFEKISGKEHYPAVAMNSKWGAHDGVVLQKQAQDLANMSQPFFSVLLTLTTHEPFEVPIATPYNGSSEPEMFKKAAWYTDTCLKDYFEKAAQTEWFKNTIFILVADHGHRLPMERAYEDPAIRHIPLLIFSPLLLDSLKGKTVTYPATQNDIAGTLLGQLNMNEEDFPWSNNILKSPRNHFAYFSLDDKIGWLTPTDTLLLPSVKRAATLDDQKDASVSARAYLQQLYQEFLDL